MTTATLVRRCSICRQPGHRRETCRQRPPHTPPDLPDATEEAVEAVGQRPMCPHCDAFILVDPGADRCPACRRPIQVRSILVASKVWR